MKRYKFIPALSAGSLFNGVLKDAKWADESSYSYWNWDNEFKYPYFLITAGHYYKRKTITRDSGLFDNPDTVVFGDSGGFQIAKGTIKWDLKIRHDIFEWLENNSTIAANLDIPPVNAEYTFNKSLAISKDNFKYFHDNQTGKTLFLNVLQGFDKDTYYKWYNEVKDFKDFGGWAIGNSSASAANLFNALYILLRNKEHKRSKAIHIFGASSPGIVLMACHLQNALNKTGCEVQIYSDSSSSNSARFGSYYSDINFNTLKFRTVHIPYLRGEKKHLPENLQEIYSNGVKGLPETTPFDPFWKKMITDDDLIEYTGRFNASLSLRNTMAFIYLFNKLQDYTLLPEYFRQDVFSPDYAKMGTIIETLVELSDNTDQLDKFYAKNLPFIKSFENKSSSKQSLIEHDFFN